MTKTGICLFLAFVLSVCGASGDTNLEYETMFNGSNVFWGAETNGLKLGLCVKAASGTDPISVVCTPLLESVGTRILWIYLPPPNSRFEMTLSDSAANLIPRTNKGKQLGRPLDQPFRLTTGMNIQAGYEGVPPLHPLLPEFLGESRFDLQDYFVITNLGKYNLKFSINVIWFPPKWKGDLKTAHVPTIKLPPVSAHVAIYNP